MPESLIVEAAGGTALLTLDRPGKRNALSRELIDALTEEIRRYVEDDAVSAIVITGSPPAFCAGLDLDELSEAANAGRERATPDGYYALLESIVSAPKPVVAAVNGDAAAGGAAMMTACDYAVAGRSARVGYPQIQRGLVAPIVIPFLLRQVGERAAKRLLLTGELWPVDDARVAGLIDEVVDDTRARGRAIEVARQFASYPAGGFVRTKRALRECLAFHDADLFARIREFDDQLHG